MAALVLTAQGRAAAENIQGRGPEYVVLSTLYEEGGPVDFEELMDALNTDDEKASMIINRLVRKGHIREV